MKAVKELAKILPQTAVKRAVVGVNSVSKRILLRAYSLLIKKGELRGFETMEAAKKWLLA